MNYAIGILKAELKHWKEALKYHKQYYRGEENDKWAIRDFKEVNKNISGDIGMNVAFMSLKRMANK